MLLRPSATWVLPSPLPSGASLSTALLVLLYCIDGIVCLAVLLVVICRSGTISTCSCV